MIDNQVHKNHMPIFKPISRSPQKRQSTSIAKMKFTPTRGTVSIRTGSLNITIHGMVTGIDGLCPSNLVLVLSSFPSGDKSGIALAALSWNTSAVPHKVRFVVCKVTQYITMFSVCACGGFRTQRMLPWRCSTAIAKLIITSNGNTLCKEDVLQ